jgi:Bacterial protein of unknown function (Gcw_chp)
MTKLRLVCAAAALAALGSGTAYAEATANIGLMSNYIFRGAYQSASTAFGGLDVETQSGFYIGTWGADVQNGLEYDIYMGYRGGGDNFKWNAGYEGYYYTDDFDNTYREWQLGFSYGFLTFDYALGEYNAAIANGDGQTYQYIGWTFEPKTGPYYFVGRMDYKNLRDLTGSGMGRIPGTGKDGVWFEIGKSFQIMEDLDISIAALYSDNVQEPQSNSPRPIVLSGTNPYAEFATVVTLTKTLHINKQ